LVDSKHIVYGVDNLKFGYVFNIPHTPVTSNFGWHRHDFNMEQAETLNQFDILVHCATTNLIYSSQHCVETFNNNALETIKLFERFKGKIIYTSTASVYNNAETFPTNEDAEIKTYGSYDTAKYIAELFLKQRGNYTTLRLSNVYGTNQRSESPYCGVVGKMISAALKNEPIQIYGNGDSTRDYTYIDDTVDAIIKAIELPAQNCPINIATGIETSANDLCSKVWKALGKPKKYTRVEPRGIDTIFRRCLDNSRAKELLGWSPVTNLDEGIKKTIRWQIEQNKTVNLSEKENESNTY